MTQTKLGTVESIPSAATEQPDQQVRDLRAIELSLAYERAAGVMESHCGMQEEDDLTTWRDLDTADHAIDDEVAYLEARGLLEHHAEHPRWVQIRDEDQEYEAPVPLNMDAQIDAFLQRAQAWNIDRGYFDSLVQRSLARFAISTKAGA